MIITIGGTCAECKWWKLKEDMEHWGECKRQYVVSKVTNTETAARMTAGYGEVDTRDDFGCVQWEPRPCE